MISGGVDVYLFASHKKQNFATIPYILIQEKLYKPFP